MEVRSFSREGQDDKGPEVGMADPGQMAKWHPAEITIFMNMDENAGDPWEDEEGKDQTDQGDSRVVIEKKSPGSFVKATPRSEIAVNQEEGDWDCDVKNGKSLTKGELRLAKETSEAKGNENEDYEDKQAP